MNYTRYNLTHTNRHMVMQSLIFWLSRLFSLTTGISLGFALYEYDQTNFCKLLAQLNKIITSLLCWLHLSVVLLAKISQCGNQWIKRLWTWQIVWFYMSNCVVHTSRSICCWLGDVSCQTYFSADIMQCFFRLSECTQHSFIRTIFWILDWDLKHRSLLDQQCYSLPVEVWVFTNPVWPSSQLSHITTTLL